MKEKEGRRVKQEEYLSNAGSIFYVNVVSYCAVVQNYIVFNESIFSDFYISSHNTPNSNTSTFTYLRNVSKDQNT